MTPAVVRRLKLRMSVIEAWSMSMTTPHVTSVRVNHQATGTPSATTTTTTARAMRRPADRLIGGGVAGDEDARGP